MKKFMLVIVSIIFLYFMFVGIDSYRIKSKPFEKVKPFITLEEVNKDNSIIYYGLGYSIEYYINDDESVYGAQFDLFNNIMLWAYVS